MSLRRRSARRPSPTTSCPVLLRYCLPQQGRADAAGRYRRLSCPLPLDIPPVHGHRTRIPTRRSPPCLRRRALLPRWRSRSWPTRSLARLAYCPRLFRHADQPAAYVYNSTKGKRERVGRIMRMHANHRAGDQEVLYAGDIAAMVGLKRHHHRRHPVRRESSDHSGVDGVPGSGYPGGHRA